MFYGFNFFEHKFLFRHAELISASLRKIPKQVRDDEFFRLCYKQKNLLKERWSPL